MSTRVDGTSHWFNRFPDAVGGGLDVDLTADQFGGPPVASSSLGTLYGETKQREWGELNAETLDRASRLASRAGLVELSQRFGPVT